MGARLKNYTTTVAARTSIDEIQQSLVAHGAIGVLFEYEEKTGRISTLAFRLLIDQSAVSFSLPVNWRNFQRVLQGQRVSRWRDEDYVYRVAWRCLRDWVLAQMALHETQMVELGQVFLPFATGQNGQTIYELVRSNQLLLGPKATS